MARKSAGLLMYRLCGGRAQVLLVHPGGPFFRKKDAGVWSIPKGEIDEDEEPLAAAEREFIEETGFTASGPFHELQPVKQKGGKLVLAWACEGECDPSRVRSNTFRLEWPPKSGQWEEFPEVDRAEFFELAEAREKILTAQVSLLDELAAWLEGRE